MTEFFDASNINDLIERMLAYIKTQTEHPKFPESGFALDKIMHLYINFHELALTRGGSYIELPKWLKSKKALINPQNKDKECFKWAVIGALHHEEIREIDKFEKNNPGIAVNVLFSNKKIKIYKQPSGQNVT